MYQLLGMVTQDQQTSGIKEISLHLMCNVSIVQKNKYISIMFLYPLFLTCVLGAQKNCLIKTVLLSTHSIPFG